MYPLVARARMAKTPNNGALMQWCSSLKKTVLGTLGVNPKGDETVASAAFIHSLQVRKYRVEDETVAASVHMYSLSNSAYRATLCWLYQPKRFHFFPKKIMRRNVEATNDDECSYWHMIVICIARRV